MVGIIVLEQIEAVLKAVLEYYHDNVGLSWGWAIVLLTVTVRIAILPLTIKQFRSMASMQRIQPKVKALQNRYKGKTDRDSKQQMQKELMELYRENNVNPFASCLPLIFQAPVFIGLYQVLSNFEPPDDRAFLGIDDIFVNLSDIGGKTTVIMVVLYCLSMLGSTLLFSFVQDRQQKILFASLSVVFIPFILQVPAGVGIYWISTNIWTIMQQAVVKQTMGHHFPSLQKEERDKAAKQPRTSRNPPKPAVTGGEEQTGTTTKRPRGGPQKPPQRKRKKRR